LPRGAAAAGTNYIRPMRSLLVTAGVALAVAGGALGAGWSVEASALPSPPTADRMAVDSLVVLQHHLFVASRLRIGGARMVRASCERGWFPRHGTLLTLDDGSRVFYRAVHPRVAPEQYAELELAGCPRVLSPVVAHLLQSGVDAHARRVWLGTPAIALHISRITLYVTPKHFVPLGVAIREPSFSGTSRLSFSA
jgi:hypothetical protein